jgi:hypothetical protein
MHGDGQAQGELGGRALLRAAARAAITALSFIGLLS